MKKKNIQVTRNTIILNVYVFINMASKLKNQPLQEEI